MYFSISSLDPKLGLRLALQSSITTKWKRLLLPAELTIELIHNIPLLVDGYLENEHQACNCAEELTVMHLMDVLQYPTVQI